MASTWCIRFNPNRNENPTRRFSDAIGRGAVKVEGSKRVNTLGLPCAWHSRACRGDVQRWGPLPVNADRPEDVVDDEVTDVVAERLPGILVVAEVLARVDAAH
jgi:hypothetical protein